MVIQLLQPGMYIRALLHRLSKSNWWLQLYNQLLSQCEFYVTCVPPENPRTEWLIYFHWVCVAKKQYTLLYIGVYGLHTLMLQHSVFKCHTCSTVLQDHMHYPS